MAPPQRRRRRPATTPEELENQLISQANDLAAQQMAAGTASPQTINHFLKMGSSRERIEQDRLRNENELLKARVESMASAKRVEELYGDALDAMRTYSGQEVVYEDEYDD